MGGRRQLPALDGLRAVAAGTVLLTHVAFRTGETGRGAGGAVLARFDAGVAIFFVLSGFLLYGSTGRLRRYALRRAARILPAYWVVVAVAALFWSVPATHWWLGQTYLGSLATPLTQTWSLGAELAFYVALPGLAALARRWEWPTLIGCAVLAYGWIVVVHLLGAPQRMLLWLPGHLDWFAVGMAVAVVARRGGPAWLGRLAAWPGTCWAAAGALLLLLSTPIAGPLTLAPVPGPEAVLKEASYALFAALLLVPCVLGPQRGVLASEPLRFLGRVSYGVFLWHLIVLDVVYRLTGWADFSGRMLAVALLTGLFSVLLGWLSWVLVERPALRLADRVARRVARGAPAHQRGGEQAERDRPERLAAGLGPARAGIEGQQAGQGERAARAGGAPAPG